MWKVYDTDSFMQELKVDCYSGYRAEETPRRFRIGARAVEVRQVVDRWLSPEHRYFKVIGDDEALYILRHDTDSDRWELTFYDCRREGKV